MVDVVEPEENLKDAPVLLLDEQRPTMLDSQSPKAQQSTDSPSKLWVEISPVKTKDLYKELDMEVVDILQDYSDNPPVEIVGEIRVENDIQYWVRHENAIVYRHLSRSFKDAHQDIVAAYEEVKASGTLPEFDPKSTQVHPKHRFRPTILVPPFKRGPPRGVKRLNPTRVSKTKSKQTMAASSSRKESDEGGSENVSSEDIGDDYDDLSDSPRKGKDESTAKPTRRSNRNTSRKTVYRDASMSPLRTRSSIRTRRGAVKSERTPEPDESESEISEATAQPKEKKRVRGRLSRPAYGNIRLIADLSEYESDDDRPLQAHRNVCDKCQEPPAHVSLNKYFAKLRKKLRGRKVAPDEEEEDRLRNLGGWVRCLKCTVGVHWKCLSKAQRDEVIKAAKRRDDEAEKEGLRPRRLETLGAYDTTDFFCNACIQGGICMYCQEVALIPEQPPELKSAPQNTGVPSNTLQTAVVSSDNTAHHNPDSPTLQANTLTEEEPRELLFRCKSCKRLAHYAHFPQPHRDNILSTDDLANHYQNDNDWQCTDCASFIYQVDKILAWRPYPSNAVEPTGQPPDHRALLPREYLVKWLDRSFRRVQWVPHMWLLSTAASKLKNFLTTGTKVGLSDAPINDEQDAIRNEQSLEPDLNFLMVDDVISTPVQAGSEDRQGPSGPLPDAERRIPKAWKTADRILDVRIWNPSKSRKKRRARQTKLSKQKRIDTDSESELDPEIQEQWTAAFAIGQEPDKKYLDTVEEWEARDDRTLSVEQASDVVWAYTKWTELGYEEATWDAPPRPSEPGYAEFEHAFRQFLESRQVFINKKSKKEAIAFDNRPKAAFDQKKLALTTDPDLGQEGKLMDFQLTGINWLFRNWWRLQPSILADDMGLGKTVQASTFVGHLVKNYNVSPVLIVVPNSTLTNWMRELARWAPCLRVVSYNGDAKARDVIRRYELYHKDVDDSHTKLKFHVLITTYESINGREFSVFKSVPRWEMLIVDEGQRLKNDASLLFKRLCDLNSIHRILMTGTPLNNNIRELFNLMNFLDPKNWDDLEALEKEYENITEDRLMQLHERLKPYFLRRTKADVLKLPPKNEVIVPLSMTSLQKELYKSLLSKNVQLIQGLVQSSGVTSNSTSKMGLRNILMDLRKCLLHPYLVQRELELQGSDLTSAMVHKNLVDASCKLRLLQVMLPKLKARGHRVLLFSQFVIALDIIEDFLEAEGFKFLRLDGNTKQAQRQKDMDAFNQANSDYFIYILSTRAGGVGINLWSADTVIIFDPDFNPHQDLQAVSRAHRYGQQKTVLVFKLMVKGAAEERIIQSGKKKLALDHLIVQKMDEEEISSDLQSILTFGAKALFEESEVNDINYTETDVEKLILRTEQEGDQVTEDTNTSGFEFAKLWTADKDTLEEVEEDVAQDQDTGFWDAMLAKATEERARAEAAEVTGRGAKRRAATTVKKYVFEMDSPAKMQNKKRASKSSGDSDIAYSERGSSQVSDDGEQELMVLDAEISLLAESEAGPSTLPPIPKAEKPKKQRQRKALVPVNNDWEGDEEQHCGLCQNRHGPGECYMTQNPLNLAEYRLMLLKESKEPLRLRQMAVYAIDTNLTRRGLLDLVKGQGNIFVEHDTQIAGQKRHSSPSPTRDNKKQKLVNGDQGNTGFAPCVVCNGPFHLIKSCPVVKAGRKSIFEAIDRLSTVPNSQPVINILKGYL